jgi:hypothetical protein
MKDNEVPLMINKEVSLEIWSNYLICCYLFSLSGIEKYPLIVIDLFNEHRVALKIGLKTITEIISSNMEVWFQILHHSYFEIITDWYNSSVRLRLLCMWA